MLFSTNQMFHQNVLVSPKFFGFRQDRRTDGRTDTDTDTINIFWAFLVRNRFFNPLSASVTDRQKHDKRIVDCTSRRALNNDRDSLVSSLRQLVSSMASLLSKYSGGSRVSSVIKAGLLFGIVLYLSFSWSIYCSLNTLSALVLETTPKNYRLASSPSTNDLELRDTKMNENRKYLNKCNRGQTLLYVVGSRSDSVVNDDFCDCSDGTDEAETPACSHYLVGQKNFMCNNHHETTSIKAKANVGHPGTSASDSNEHHDKIYASRVNDDVCDCDNCSDEEIIDRGELTSRCDKLQVVQKRLLRHRQKKDEGFSGRDTIMKSRGSGELHLTSCE